MAFCVSACLVGIMLNMPRRRRIVRANRQQPYPRERGDLLAKKTLFPQPNPPMTDSQVASAAGIAFRECGLTRSGKVKDVPSSPEALVKVALSHLKERTDPIDGVAFFSSVEIEDIFLDAIFHEMHRHKMQMGDYYHKFILELMKESRSLSKPNIQNANDGPREGDIIADVKTAGFSSGIRVYGSVKKSGDTVGGQDFSAALHRLERVAQEDQGRRRPYLCAFMIGNPIKGILRSYEDSRHIRGDRQKRPYSENGEVWEPGFIFPFVTGRPAHDVFKISLGLVEDFFPYFTIKYRKEASRRLRDELEHLGLIASHSNRLDRDAFLKFVTNEN